MSKEATIIQSFNDVKRQYEYSVKGYNITESVKILLKRHKEEYDKEKNIFAGIDGYLEAQKECQSQISDLEAKLAGKDQHIKELEEENAELKNQIEQADQQIQFMLDEIKNRGTCGLCEKLENKQIKELKEQLAIREKALELACKELMPYRVNMCGGLYTTEELTKKIDYFIEQAKEILEKMKELKL